MRYYLILFFCIPLLGAELPDKVDFNKHIRPILSDRCYKCHGPDGGEFGEMWKGGLRLDTEKGAKANLAEVKLTVKNNKRKKEGAEPLPSDGKKVFALVPGDVEKSTLVQRVFTNDKDDVMPPSDSNLHLSNHEKELLKKWVAQGAEWGHHWSFEVPVKTEVPKVKNSWGKNEIDYFVQQKLSKKNILPNPETDKISWLRRVYLDLAGVPPTTEQAEKFLADESAQAYEKVVDEIFSSNHFAERLSLEWLDSSRYADTSGYQYDMPRTMWPWRDWVIQAFRNNMTYDQFVTKQLAGDLLPNFTSADKIASGFNRNHGFTIEGGVISEEYRIQYVNDRVTTVGTLFLGLTMDCTRCHNHKYDPLTMEDFYSMSAFFDKIDEPGVGGGKPLAVKPFVDYKFYDEKFVADLQSELDKLRKSPLPEQDKILFENWKKSLAEPNSRTEIISAVSSSGATVTKLEDNSFQFSGTNGEKDTYTFELKVSENKIRSLVVEVLPDENKKLGRAENGNAVLTGIELVMNKQNINITEAVADYSQKEFDVNSLTRKNGKGWGIGGNENPKNRIAVFGFKNELSKSDKPLTLKLMFNSAFTNHSFARVRLSFSNRNVNETLNMEKFKNSFKQGLLKEEKLQEEFVSNHLNGTALSAKMADVKNKIEEEKKKVVPVMVMEEKPGIRETFILERGEYDKKGAKVTAYVPHFLNTFDGFPKNRLGLAQWLISPENPLFARVTVNRYWQMLFGYGLVKTSEDFGAQGETPSHPELLDWLAVDFRENGWDLRKLLKKMVLSATYRQSSKVRSELEDPENRLLARGARFRLQAEILRDQALFVAGQLSDKVGGPSVYPYQPAGIWLDLTNRPGFQMFYTQSQGDDLYRKSLYTFWKRAMPNPSMTALDAPTRDVCIVKRDRTNTPLQALVLLHDPGFVEAARILADKAMRENVKSIEEKITATFRKVLLRRPTVEELKILGEVYKVKLANFQKKPELVKAQLAVGEYKHNPGLNETELAAFTAVCQVLFNLSETVTKN